ncbi:3-oxoacyl-(acyl-carrier-protein) synthase [Minicystis rosea]|nr:3-oxoacyl-(acyl-carrier-protein) synthase [Minicystis rosea]
MTLTSARTAVGPTVDQTCASIRANLIRLREDPSYVTIPADPADEPRPARIARVDDVDPALDGRDRLLALLEPTLADMLEHAEHLRRDAPRAALLVALPAADAITDAWDLATFPAALLARLGVPFASVHVSRAGRTGVFALLSEASGILARGAAELCVVAGVDSYLTPARLAHYDEAERLRSPRNADGFFPGEAAAALLVEPERRVTARGATAHLQIVGLGSGNEPETVRSDKPSTGKGLTDALRKALGDTPAPRWAISDFNGETYRGYEWGLVHARLGDRLNALEAMSYPARNTGDIGAASGAVLVSLAAAAFRRGWAPDGEAILWTGSDGTERAAARVAKTTEA